LSQPENKLRGKFITFEGIDGAGKSSHIAAAAAFVRDQG
jgi:dTMP kinase